MEVILHLPTTKEGMEALQDRLAETHAQIIIDKINALDWPYESKIKLFENVKAELKRQAEEEERGES
ncbi:MAG: hypothetical protein GX962_05260 [Epulopiscium sp.]|nr:hypothetical protein [Candidatus Epulonipiscium sp.]